MARPGEGQRGKGLSPQDDQGGPVRPRGEGQGERGSNQRGPGSRAGIERGVGDRAEDPGEVIGHDRQPKLARPRPRRPVTGPGDTPTAIRSTDTATASPGRPRTEFDQDELDRLSESIKAHGILAPLRVRFDSATGKYCIIVGERRYRAASQVEGLDRVPCIIVEGAPTERDILESQIAENVIRLDLNPIDQSRAYQRYMSLTGCSGKELANLLHISPATVSRALSLLELPDEVQDAVVEGKISPRAGHAIAKIKNSKVQQKVATKAAETKAPVAEVEKQVRQRQGTPAKPSQQPQPFVQF